MPKYWTYEIRDKDTDTILATVSGFETENDAKEQASMDANITNIKNYYISTVENTFESTNTEGKNTNGENNNKKPEIYDFSSKTKKPCGDEPNQYPESVQIKFPNGAILTYTLEWQIPHTDD